MAKQRAKITMTWQIAIMAGLPGTPFSTIEDFKAYARGHLQTRFATYNATVGIEVVEDFESIAVLRLTWEVDLDMVRGGWHQPEDHERFAQNALVDAIPHYGRKLKIDSRTVEPVAFAA